MATDQAQALPPAEADPFKDGPPPEHRRAWMRAVQETIAAIQPDRDVSTRTHVPHLLLLLDYYWDCDPRLITVEDIAEWNADADAQQALVDWLATAERSEEEVA